MKYFINNWEHCLTLRNILKFIHDFLFKQRYPIVKINYDSQMYFLEIKSLIISFKLLQCIHLLKEVKSNLNTVISSKLIILCLNFPQ